VFTACVHCVGPSAISGPLPLRTFVKGGFGKSVSDKCLVMRRPYRSVRLIFVVLLSTILPGIPDDMTAFVDAAKWREIGKQFQIEFNWKITIKINNLFKMSDEGWKSATLCIFW
jgi:hypothetical protein